MADTTDPVAAYLAETGRLIAERDALIARHAASGVLTASIAEFNAAQDRLADRTPPLLAALEAVLADHDNRGVFLGADDCDHPEPAEEYAVLHDWDADHPPGLGDIGRICLLTETGRYCPACTRLVYDDDPLGDSYVDASNCIVRPAISAKLLGSQKAPAGEETSHG